jgi:hypothetical protein
VLSYELEVLRCCCSAVLLFCGFASNLYPPTSNRILIQQCCGKQFRKKSPCAFWLTGSFVIALTLKRPARRSLGIGRSIPPSSNYILKDPMNPSNSICRKTGGLGPDNLQPLPLFPSIVFHLHRLKDASKILIYF